MLKTLSDRIHDTLQALRGQSHLNEKNIQDAIGEIRRALLEADVALPVIKQLIERVSAAALNQEVLRDVSPSQTFIKIVHDELVEIMGREHVPLSLSATPPCCMLFVGLQGSGKTTSLAKLARHLKEEQKKRVFVVSCDVHRPGAIEQLAILADEVGVECVPSHTDQNPTAIAQAAIDSARRAFADVLLIDTAGRLQIDEAMMREVSEIHAASAPTETLFVIDAMAGQDAAEVARAFDEALPLSGIILTKTDGDARAGVALSARMITGKPIKFIGTGERTGALELFHPERLVGRILGMGDIVTLVEEAQQKIDHQKAKKFADKIRKGVGFDLEDLRTQLQQMQKMGGLSALADKLPTALMGQVNIDAAQMKKTEQETARMIALINSMTPHERRFPALLKTSGSRKRRIAQGSGSHVQGINQLIKKHTQMSRMMKKVGKGGLGGKMRSMLGGNQPPPGLGG